ncbi:MAG: aldose epimerase family protein [Oscillospiraceae bacterium]
MQIDDFSFENIKAKKFFLENENIKLVLTNFGATIISIFTKDKDDVFDDIICGFDTLKEYYEDTQKVYFGATIGRCANRIANGEFEINSKKYIVAKNAGQCHLHGGIKGFSYKVFDYKIISEKEILYIYFSEDMEEGYPGNLSLKVTYKLSGNTLKIIYDGVCDKDTICNITNHAYFNLDGHKSKDVTNHIIKMDCEGYAIYDDNFIPMSIGDVSKTSVDFNIEKSISKAIDFKDKSVKLSKGLDHHFNLKEISFDNPKESPQFLIYSPKSNRSLKIKTTQRGMQVYTANYFNNINGKDGAIYGQRSAVALEMQNIPNAINSDKSSILKKCQAYHQQSDYIFGLIK